MKDDVIVKFKKLNSKYIFEIIKENYKYAAGSNSLAEAENAAYDIINNLKNVGTIHTIYESGKHVDVATVPIKDVMINE